MLRCFIALQRGAGSGVMKQEQVERVTVHYAIKDAQLCSHCQVLMCVSGFCLLCINTNMGTDQWCSPVQWWQSNITLLWC